MASKISLDLLQKRSHASIDINQPPKIEDNSEVGSTSMEKVKSSTMNSKVNEYERCSYIDSILKLSPKRLNSGNLPTCIVSPKLGGTAKDELPPLVVMRCSFCYMYVMASKADSKCPKCKNCMLMIADKFQGGTAKDEPPPSIVMRCTFCYMYVMTSKADPKCPNCKNCMLMIADKFQGGTAKDEPPQSVVMGCTFCYMYVMTSKAGRKCPKCKNCMSVIADKFQLNTANRIGKTVKVESN